MALGNHLAAVSQCRNALGRLAILNALATARYERLQVSQLTEARISSERSVDQLPSLRAQLKRMTAYGERVEGRDGPVTHRPADGPSGSRKVRMRYCHNAARRWCSGPRCLVCQSVAPIRDRPVVVHA
jgi:hypothetical protein